MAAPGTNRNDIDGEAAADAGTNVSISGDTVVAIGADGNDATGSMPATRIYKWDGSQWNQLGNDIDGEAVLDATMPHFCISQPTAPSPRLALMERYQWSRFRPHPDLPGMEVLNQIGNDIEGEAAGDRSGHSVSVSKDGRSVAIGSIRNDGNGDKSAMCGVSNQRQHRCSHNS